MQEDDIYRDLRRKYMEKLQATLNDGEGVRRSHQYESFRREYLPKPLSFYEKWCNVAGKVLPFSPAQKRKEELESAIAVCHLQTTATATQAFALLVPFILVLMSMFLFFLLPTLLGFNGSLFVTVYAIILAIILYIPLSKIPDFLAASWRMRASNQMVLCIFYIVTYMRHTSNLELAIDFAADHLSAPLSLDMKKVIWNLETEKYESLKESLEAYLDTWHGHNDEFIESIHLIESSLVETSETRRIDALDKSLQVMLEETYEKMLHYAHNLKGPLTTLHMLGIILPILGLVILPLLVAFMPEVRWYHIFMLYNVTLPALVYMIGRDILSKRPTGYGATEVDDSIIDEHAKNPFFTPFVTAVFVFCSLLLIGTIPLLMNFANPDFDLVIKEGEDCAMIFCPVDTRIPDEIEGSRFWFNEYREVVIDEVTGETIRVGPFGLVATLLSLCVPLAFGAGIGLYFKMRSKNTVKLRERAKKLELEFASALFQLGNRLADGLPLEISFSKVAAVLPDTISGRFFGLVSANITKLGLSVEDAIFHPKYGALHQYPSNLLESSMKVLVESARKGPLIASQAIINVSNYIKEMHRVDERLRDLMADVISSMKSQISFLTPTIAGIVIGITSMITAILGKLGERVRVLGSETGESASAVAGSSLLSTFSGGAVPTYFFQLVVGLYVVELVFVLTILVNGIENGSDKTGERYSLGQNLIHSTMTYISIAFVVILLFNIVAANIVPTG